MISLDSLLRNEAGSFALEAIRVGGVVIASPLVWNGTPARVRLALVLLTALAAHGQSSGTLEIAGSAERIAMSVGSEFLLGLAIGMVVRLVIAAVEVASEQIALMMGLGIAQVFDPQVHGSINVLGGLLRNLSLLVAVAVGLHRIVLEAVIQSFRVVPLGSAINMAVYGPTFGALGSQVFATGVRIALPVLAVLFMTQVGLAFIARAAPAMQIFSIGFAVTLSVGTFVLTLVAPDLAYAAAAEMSQVPARIEELLSLVTSGGA